MERFIAFLANLYYHKQSIMKFRFRFFLKNRPIASLVVALTLALTLCAPFSVSAQQAIPTTSAEKLKKIASEASDIEALIVAATPRSIAKAQAAILTSTFLSAPDKAALDGIARGVALIVYGPKDAKVELPAAAQGATPKYIACLAGLGDASAGKIPQVFNDTTCSTMTELISSLPFFRSTRSEIRAQALAALGRFKELNGVSAVPYLIEGQIAYESKEYTTAQSDYLKALAMDDQSQRAACGVAQAALALSAPLDARKALDPILSSTQGASNPASAPANASALSASFMALYGLALYELNDVLDAQPWLAAALAADSGHTEILIPLAQAAMQKRDYQSAWKYLESASKIASTDRMWLILKSEYALENMRQSDAERFARSAVQYYPKDPASLAQLVMALQKSTDDARHTEAIGLATAVIDLTNSVSAQIVPLEQARTTQARDEALQYLVSENYARQNWADAAKYLQMAGNAPLDNQMVATILRKSGDVSAAVTFAKNWYVQDPGSEKAVEAYLRSLALTTGGGLASAAPASDVHTGLGLALSAFGVTQPGNENAAMLDLVVKFIAAPFSKELKSFLYYMSASLQSDENKAIDQLKDSLVERADNVEALVSLSAIYLARYQRQTDKSDSTNRDKALRYLTQAESLNPTDNDIRARIAQLKAQLK